VLFAQVFSKNADDIIDNVGLQIPWTSSSEDEAITLNLMPRILEEWNYGVVTASDGTEAWDTLKKTMALYVNPY
jgi:hypothetical protein